MLELSGLFSDHAVLQREMPIAIWGWAAPGTTVEANLGEGRAVGFGRTGDDGKFLIRLAPQPAGGPWKLEVKQGRERIELQDLYIGEVWLAGGQSNMEMPLGGFQTPIPEAEAIEFGAPVRMITLPRVAELSRTTRVRARWTRPENRETLLRWSAAGAYFASRLSRELKIPVGIVASNWGGTIAEAWISRETLLANPDTAAKVTEYELFVSSPAYREIVEKAGVDSPEFATLSPEDRMARLVSSQVPTYPPNRGVAAGWAATDCDDRDWPEMKAPDCWQTQKDMDFSGVVWFRREVEIPAAWAGRRLILAPGAVDKHDVTYFNGVEVGATGTGLETGHWNVPRHYPVAPELVRPGRAVIAVRAYSFLFGGGLVGPASEMKLYCAESPEPAIPLAGAWRYRTELNLGGPRRNLVGTGCPNSYSILYDSMIHPLLPCAMRGVIWYQGESNEEHPELYARLMTDLIGDWRRAWGNPHLAFYQVLLASFRRTGNPAWPLIREAQIQAAEATGTGYASAVDTGDETDIHPLDKRTIGERLALRALADTYGCPVEGEGPTLAEVHLTENAVELLFSHAAGLFARGEPAGFELAGADGTFRQAAARIAGNRVLLSFPDGNRPCRVRYAWSENAREANCYNGAGLPMVPFRAPC